MRIQAIRLNPFFVFLIFPWRAEMSNENAQRIEEKRKAKELKKARKNAAKEAKYSSAM